VREWRVARPAESGCTFFVGGYDQRPMRPFLKPSAAAKGRDAPPYHGLFHLRVGELGRNCLYV